MLPGIMGLALAGMNPTVTGGAVSVSPTAITRSAGTRGPDKTLTTANVTATGGSSYSWARKSGSALITATAPASAITAFTATLSADEEAEAVFTCTIDGTQTVDVTVTITLIFIDIGGTL